MIVHLADFLIEFFNPNKNIERDLEWIIGYSSRENMRKLDYSTLNLTTDNCSNIEIPLSVYSLVSREISSDDIRDIEKAINLFYISLYILGGRN